MREALAGPIPPQAGRRLEAPEFESNLSRAEFEAIVSRIVEYVHAGDAFARTFADPEDDRQARQVLESRLAALRASGVLAVDLEI